MDEDSSEKQKPPGLRVLPEEKPLRLDPTEQSMAREDRRHFSSAASAGTISRDAMVTGETRTIPQDNEQEWGGGSRKAPMLGWFALAGLVLIGIGLWAVASMYRAQDETGEVSDKKEKLAQDMVKDQQDIKAIQQSMSEAASSYVEARTIEEKLAYARQPERVKPLMVEYYRDHKLTASKFLGFGDLTPFALDSLPFVMARVHTDDGTVVFFMEQLSDGRFLIDWETDVGYQPLEWETFLREKPVQAVAMKVWVSRDNFYAYEFRDEKKYQCYRLTDSRKQQHVFAYVERGSAQMSEIEKKLGPNSINAEPAGLILRIRYPEKSQSKRCVVIDEVLSLSWIYSTPPEGDGGAGQ